VQLYGRPSPVQSAPRRLVTTTSVVPVAFSPGRTVVAGGLDKSRATVLIRRMFPTILPVLRHWPGRSRLLQPVAVLQPIDGAITVPEPVRLQNCLMPSESERS
jgi:hypothetical protein